ncbi:unnamed protein product [Prorocentrum cordatum]|uniref:Methyltransferase FkbM domain-containing protein n=1 Tax=Prorocentrum cordatum TaxID=2364126 RepID=A0ABN9VIT4_9DINO|nr:unnamed protein product [Polarella glacialis]
MAARRRAAPAAAAAPAMLALALSGLPLASPAVADEFFDLVASRGLAEPPAGLMLCCLGLSEGAAGLARRILEGLAPPRFRAHVAFFHKPPSGATLEEADSLLRDFPERAHLVDDPEPFRSLCSVLLLSPEDPRFHAEQLRALARPPEVLVAHAGPDCGGRASYACRFFEAAWGALASAKASCGHSFCFAVLPLEELEDPLLTSVDCKMLAAPEAPPFVASQWQQDWFVYHNFIRGTDLDPLHGPPAREGVFVDIGAFHPIHLSNTFFFERCLGWRGVCAEPNPSWGPYFGAYRPRCRLAQNCVWSAPRSVVMSFEKDPIEAYIQDVPNAGAVPISDAAGATARRFTAECRTLEDILTSSGLRRPARIDYMSVDAEAAEVEIFRGFDFALFSAIVCRRGAQKGCRVMSWTRYSRWPGTRRSRSSVATTFTPS